LRTPETSQEEILENARQILRNFDK
jgi:hypothetical protein